ncbi:hypothetical protein DEU56DRAFT_73350 [Suillus clintonianus]|uniref:uncharacterized protein n=1 Tax=Suillus clintonianus TaxID=1904413 RepID=UPI001B8653DB|nr:uncharacterized protein DEU56DRAFT_73350 [Suillus clintonianus]KAG2122468.1 hypothetical protein DEU56DRAFT_73350 [Suillus clintonianus]
MHVIHLINLLNLTFSLPLADKVSALNNTSTGITYLVTSTPPTRPSIRYRTTPRVARPAHIISFPSQRQKKTSSRISRTA